MSIGRRRARRIEGAGVRFARGKAGHGAGDRPAGGRTEMPYQCPWAETTEVARTRAGTHAVCTARTHRAAARTCGAVNVLASNQQECRWMGGRSVPRGWGTSRCELKCRHPLDAPSRRYMELRVRPTSVGRGNAPAFGGRVALVAMRGAHRLVGSGHLGPATMVHGRDFCWSSACQHPQATCVPSQHDLRPEQCRYRDQRDSGTPTGAEGAKHLTRLYTPATTRS